MTGKFRKIDGGIEYFGVAAFVTTGTTLLLDVPKVSLVAGSVTYLGTPALADGPISINGAVAADGTIKRDANGFITIQRVAGSTSGQKFMFRFRMV